MQGWLDLRGPAACVRAVDGARACCVRDRREPAKDLQIDPRRAWRPSAANEDDKTIERLRRTDRQRKDREGRPHQGADRARRRLCAQGHDRPRHRRLRRVLRLDPTLADVFNARGELWRKKGDRPKALADFGAAIKLNPDHAVGARPITSRWRRNWNGSAR